MTQWYYKKVDGIRGPFSLQILMDLYAKGTIDKDTLIRHSGIYDWYPLKHYDKVLDNREKGKLEEQLRIKVEPSLVKFLVDFGFNHLDPFKFEELVLKIFEAFGYKGQLTQVTRDEGIDVLLEAPDSKKVVVQCKRYIDDQIISARDVRELLGAMVHAEADFGIFITTTTFSEQAKEFSKNKNIFLVGGEKLKQLYILAVDFEYGCAHKDPIKFISENQ
ncbi:MAG: restriction endonuclease [Elusimicrobiota bacterium]